MSNQPIKNPRETDNKWPHLLCGLDTYDVFLTGRVQFKLSDIVRKPDVIATSSPDLNLFFFRTEQSTITYITIMTKVTHDETDAYLEHLWSVEGILPLKEMRHSWIGPEVDGYIFYADPDQMIAAAEHLKSVWGKTEP